MSNTGFTKSHKYEYITFLKITKQPAKSSTFFKNPESSRRLQFRPNKSQVSYLILWLAQSRNYGATETAIASWRLCNRQKWGNCWKRYLSCGPCRDCISRGSLETAVFKSTRLVWDGRQPTRTCAREQGNVHLWRHRRLRRLSTCCSELQCVWISDSATVTCSYYL
jgi:hypothetical protein